MLVRSAEKSFDRGLEALQAGRLREAMALFEAALEIERRRGVAVPQPRYLSFYGLCLGLEAGRMREAIRVCREATTLEFYNPDLYHNLGCLLLAAGRRKEAYEAFSRGYSLQPGHPGLRRELERMGRRRRPPLGFLARSHPLNVLLGKLSRATSRRAEPPRVEKGTGAHPSIAARSRPRGHRPGSGR